MNRGLIWGLETWIEIDFKEIYGVFIFNKPFIYCSKCFEKWSNLTCFNAEIFLNNIAWITTVIWSESNVENVIVCKFKQKANSWYKNRHVSTDNKTFFEMLYKFWSSYHLDSRLKKSNHNCLFILFLFSLIINISKKLNLLKSESGRLFS